MNKKNNYYDNDGADVKRAARKKKKKGNKALKGFLIFISAIVVALAVFVTTVKVLAPDFDFTTLIPEKAQTFVKEEVLHQTTTTLPTTTKPTTTEKPTAKDMSYIEFEEFKMNTSKQGNMLGSLMNGGKVATDYSYIYHITNSGIYRFEPQEESYKRIYKTTHVLSSLNLRGDYIYFVDENENKLYRMKKGSSEPKSIADGVKFAYVYSGTVYFVTTTNDLKIMDTDDLEPTTLYSSADDELRLVGISRNRVYFAVRDYSGNIDYLTIAEKGEKLAAHFRDSETDDSMLVMENGFMYFYKSNASGKYDVCRQKYGSEKVVTLASDGDASNYIAVENNRLYYSEFKDGTFYMTEINMNKKESRYLLAIKDASADHKLKLFHGGEYDFIIGEKNAQGTSVYRASCMYTGSTNTMKFSDGKWKY